jgi:hypothetical protein
VDWPCPRFSDPTLRSLLDSTKKKIGRVHQLVFQHGACSGQAMALRFFLVDLFGGHGTRRFSL